MTSSSPLKTNASQETIYENPMNTDGFEFVEFAAPDPSILDQLFKKLGFKAIAKHRSKDVTLYRQGICNFILNNEPNSYASEYAKAHGPSACAMAFRVKDAAFAHKRALSLGAEDALVPVEPNELKIPAIKGIGDSLLFFVDQYGSKTIYDTDFIPLPGVDQHPVGFGLTYIDHLTHNVYQGRMDVWAGFYEKLFNFREQRYFNITGQKTGLLSRAMISPCGKIRIPINESADDISQIAEGIQHIALETNDICDSVEKIREQGVNFMTVPETYYEIVEERLPGHNQDIERIKKNHILMDGEIEGNRKDLLLQIFTDTVIGPIFFEIIQRKGHDGFGEGNFSALFESMEREQMRRGII
jgi:4-hydroxyphenylpyruvate dioxygenase